MTKPPTETIYILGSTFAALKNTVQRSPDSHSAILITPVLMSEPEGSRELARGQLDEVAFDPETLLKEIKSYRTWIRSHEHQSAPRTCIAVDNGPEDLLECLQSVVPGPSVH